MSQLRGTRFIAGVLPLILVATASANPANKSAMAKHFGSLMPDQMQTCALCHVGEHADDASSLDDFPHNPFGDAIRVAGEQLIEQGKADSISDRVTKIAEHDADGDGFGNVLEILLGSLPGDPNDVPTAENLTRQSDLLAAYQERLNDYAWRPFHPVNRPDVPTSNDNWGHNAIDAFIAEKHRQARVAPQGEARPEHLLRRLYLDLIGLSPSADEMERFVSEYELDPRAYDRAVEELLAHPGYGERWGRHWMDIWRYSDWAGYKEALRESQRHIWHWRDWMIESLNEDMGYDQMLMRMLAADEMQLDDQELRATGYLARNYFTNRDQWMDNLVKHTSQAFMGITLGCAKCHDHMSDPFAQSEYYALRAIFEPHDIRTDRVPGELDLSKNGIPRAYDRSVNAKTYPFQRGDERYPDKDRPIDPATPESLGGTLEVTPISLSHDAARPDQRPFVMEDLRNQARQRIAKAQADDQRAAAEQALEALEAEFALEAKEVAGLSRASEEWEELATRITVLQRTAESMDADWQLAEATRQFEASDEALRESETKQIAVAITKAKKTRDSADKALRAAAERAERAKMAMSADVSTEFTRREQSVYPQESSGRRLAFARWLANPQNPLTARVAVNHIWARHFGRGIVPTVNDLGGAGRTPTHPALLDWLASDLMDQSWSMKSIHRLIVTSATYRMDSSITLANQTLDPDNEYYWHGPSRRMEGEIVRDNLLQIAGRLDTTMGGPDIDHHLAEQSRRRSIYLRHAHEKLVEFVQIFDGPAVSECYLRETSIQPHQALALANSKLTVDAAEAIAAELEVATAGDDLLFLKQSFLRVLGRQASDEEIILCLDFLRESSRSRHNLILVLLNHNDFVMIR